MRTISLWPNKNPDSRVFRDVWCSYCESLNVFSYWEWDGTLTRSEGIIDFNSYKNPNCWQAEKFKPKQHSQSWPFLTGLSFPPHRCQVEVKVHRGRSRYSPWTGPCPGRWRACRWALLSDVWSTSLNLLRWTRWRLQLTRLLQGAEPTSVLDWTTDGERQIRLYPNVQTTMGPAEFPNPPSGFVLCLSIHGCVLELNSRVDAARCYRT